MYVGTYVRMYVYEHYIKICWHSKFPLLSQGTYLLFSAKGTLVETSITAKVMGWAIDQASVYVAMLVGHLSGHMSNHTYNL